MRPYLDRKIAELAKRIEQYEQQRQRSIELLSDLKKKWQRKEISYEEYKKLLNTVSNGRTLYQWIEFYEHWIRVWNKEIDAIKFGGTRIVASKLFSLAIILLLLLGLFYLGSFITSFVIREETKVYSENLDLEFNETSEYIWQLENPGKLDFVRISGEIKGDGRVKVYLDNLLVLDSRYLQETIDLKDRVYGTTGSVIYEKEIVSENVTEPLNESIEEIDIIVEEKPEIISEEISLIKFLDICEETCNLSGMNLSKTNYTIRVEIENAILKIDSVQYQVIEVLEEETKIPEIGAMADTDPPIVDSPADKVVDIAEEATIIWTITDNSDNGTYYVEKNGSSFIGLKKWFNDTSIFVIPNSYFLGNWNYTIFYNDSAGNNGIPDTVIVTVNDSTVPSCEEGAGLGVPVLLNITIDGNMTDWDSVLLSEVNYNPDLSEGGGDLDTKINADRDLLGFAYTWNDQQLYFYFRKLNAASSTITVLVYMDYGNDGYMNSSDQVLIATWSGSNRKYNSDLFDYVPVGADGDLMNGSGYDMPGSVTLNKTLDSQTIGGSEDGLAVEIRVNWSDLGQSEPVSIVLQAATSLGINLPSQLLDNVDVTTSGYRSLIFQPNNSRSARNGTSVFYAHDLLSCSLYDEVIELDNSSSNGWGMNFYYPNGSLIGDSDSNGKPDVFLEPENYTAIILEILVPGSIESGTTDIAQVTATSTTDSSLTATMTDTTSVGNLFISPRFIASDVAEGMTGIFNYTISNYQDFQDVIDITAISQNNWNISFFYQNWTELNDTDSNGYLDIGSLLPSESINILTRVKIPGNANLETNETSIIRINSSLEPDLSITSILNLTVKKRIAINPDYDRSAGIGENTYYYLIIHNNWNSSDIVDLAYTSVLNWSTVFLASDRVTPLTDSDNDSLVDLNLSGYGNNGVIYVRVTIPEGTQENDIEITTIYANSSENTSAFDSVSVNTTARTIIFYETAARTIEKDIFEYGETVYARAHNLVKINNVYYQWIDTNNTVQRVSPDIAVSTQDTADDEFTSNTSMPLGNYTVVLFNAKGDVELTRTIFQVKDFTPPSVTALRPIQNTTYNYSEIIEIAANVTDPYQVTHVLAQITLPNSTIEQIILNRIGNTTKYNNSYELLKGGLYNVRIIANDSSNNVNNSETTYFNSLSAVEISFQNYYALNSSFGQITSFNTSNLEEIEYLELNLSIFSSGAGNITNWYLNFTANGTGACALGNKQNSICYNYSNSDYKWIQVINQTETNTFDATQPNQDDNILVSSYGSAIHINISFRIDEHYNPNIFKWYGSRYNFSDVKLQNATQQRITNKTIIKIEVNQSLIPLDADQYKIDFGIGYSGNPNQPLLVYLCNSTYAVGVDYTGPDCVLSSIKYSYQFKNSSKFRGIFTNNVVDELGDIKYVLLVSGDANISNYYYLNTYKATTPSHTTHWEYSNDDGDSWSNLNDDYETDLNINWFYNGIDPSSFVYRLWANATDGSDNYFEGNITWNINAAYNYAPLGNIISPIDDIMFSLPFNITFFLADPNDNNLNASLFLYKSGILNKTLVTGMNQSNTSYYFNNSVEDGAYDLVLEICELNTLDLFCINDSHKIYIDATAPNVTYLAPIQNSTYNFSDIIEIAANVSDNIQLDTVLVNITYPNGVIEQLILNNVSSIKYNISYTVPGLVGRYNLTFIANDTSGNINDFAITWFNTIGPKEAPKIVYISPISSNVNPTEATYTRVSFDVEIYDADGVGNINDTGILVNFTRSDFIRKTACDHNRDINITNANYTCNVDMWYWDEPGDWNVSIIAYDLDGNSTGNDSFASFQYNQLTAMTLSPNTLSWSIASGSINKPANNDPMIVNNTGNVNFTLEINSTNLYGEINTSEAIYAGNMSVSVNNGGTPAAECFDVILSAGKFVNITNSILNPGNNSAGEGQEELYYCIKYVGFVDWQNYSTQQSGSWTIRVIVLLAALIIKRKRKIKNKIHTILSVPVTIFSQDLGILESLVKYMKENLDLGHNEIAELLNRDQRTIWNVYHKAKMKQKSEIIFEKTLIYLPITIFQNRELTPLESIVVYLKDNGMRYNEIAELLKRDQRNIWITYAKSVKKLGKSLEIHKKEEITNDISIIATIFSNKLGILESLVKYMKENMKLNYKEIAELLNRDQRTVWTAYSKSHDKFKIKIKPDKTLVYLPVGIFKNRELSPLESIIVYLKEQGLRYTEIAKLLKRDQRNIWITYAKSVKKINL